MLQQSTKAEYGDATLGAARRNTFVPLGNISVKTPECRRSLDGRVPECDHLLFNAQGGG